VATSFNASPGWDGSCTAVNAVPGGPTSQTLWDQIERLAWTVESVMPRLLSHVLGHGVVGADETTWEMFDHKPGQGKSWYVWMFRVDSGVYYTIRDGRSHTKVESLVASFAGVLMCDGYSGYAALSNKYPRVILAHCWARVRREFVDIEKSFPVRCGEVLDLIGKLYAIEKDCRAPGGEDLATAREEKSRPVIDEIVAWVYNVVPKCLPESGLHKASVDAREGARMRRERAMAKRKRRKFSAEFKAEAVRLCKAGDRAVRQVAIHLRLASSVGSIRASATCKTSSRRPAGSPPLAASKVSLPSRQA
jgi:hypothetical protein